MAEELITTYDVGIRQISGEGSSATNWTRNSNDPCDGTLIIALYMQSPASIERELIQEISESSGGTQAAEIIPAKKTRYDLRDNVLIS